MVLFSSNLNARSPPHKAIRFDMPEIICYIVVLNIIIEYLSDKFSCYEYAGL